LQNKEAIKELFGSVSATIGDRPGGYTRVIRTGFRLSDGAEMALIELVDYNEVYSADSKEKKSTRRRTRRSRGKGPKATVTFLSKAQEEEE
jgi:large subunit ribosomal protein L17